MQTPQFVAVDGEDGIALKSIVPISKTPVDDYGVEIQFLNAGGESIEDKDYMWIGGQWCNMLDEQPISDSVTIDPGNGVWVFSYMGESAIKLQTAGAVCKDDVDVDLDQDYGAVGVGNPYPVAISLDDLVPVAEGAVDDYGVEIQCLNAGGESIEDQDYLWIGGKWCNMLDEQPATGVSFEPGKGIWVFSYMGETPVKLRIAAPEAVQAL